MNAGNRIIDRDIAFYHAEVDYCEEHLARCFPSQEKYWVSRRESAIAVHDALVFYRTRMDGRRAPGLNPLEGSETPANDAGSSLPYAKECNAA